MNTIDNELALIEKKVNEAFDKRTGPTFSCYVGFHKWEKLTGLVIDRDMCTRCGQQRVVGNWTSL